MNSLLNLFKKKKLTGKEYLEQLQIRLSAATTEQSDDEFKKRINEWKNDNKQLDDIWLSEIKENIELIKNSNCSTIYDDRILSSIISDLKIQVEKSILDLGKEVPIVTIGSLPLGHVNAFSSRVPFSNEYIIAMNSGLFGFIYLLSKIMAGLFNFQGESDERNKYSISLSDANERIAKESIHSKRFIDLLSSYLILKDPWKSQQYLLEHNLMPIVEMLTNSAEMFVLSHEYAHIVAGHCTKSNIKKSKAKSWAHEIIADYFGVLVMLNSKSKDGVPISLSLCSAQLIFTGFEIVEKALSIKNEDSTHPSAEMRKEYMVKQLSTRITNKEELNEAIEFSNFLGEILQNLWVKSESKYRKIESIAKAKRQ